ncbi:MAG: lipoate--protein ligase family protein [Myxococcales bacterium]|nr:lipoate--protein ligase family protein [Myxococcales bacterium]
MSRWLTSALESLGVEAVAGPFLSRQESFQQRFRTDPSQAAGRPKRGDFDCFARPASREICVGGRKLAGSAQRRAKNGILQHGSIRLAPDPLEARRASCLSGTGATSLAELGANPDPGVLRAACVEAFEEALRGLEAGELTAEERAEADARVRDHRRDSRFAPLGYAQRASRRPIAGR